MLPPATRRIRWLLLSEIYSRLPEASSNSPCGLASHAFVARPPSFTLQQELFPANVVIVPPDTLRTRLLFRSAMYTFPWPSTATATGLFSCADVAAAPSPENPEVPVPA